MLSTWFTLIFFIFLVFYLGFIEFFQDTKDEQITVDLLKSPIQQQILNSSNFLKFKNRIGNFTLKKEAGDWILQEPRIMPAKVETINQILSALKQIKIQTIHQHEPINFQSFSLDKPVIEVELQNKQNVKMTIKVGLINPINNTSYLTVSGHNYIYQTNFIDDKLQSFTLADFIDSNIFSMDKSSIKQLKIYHGKSKDAYNTITHSNEIWSTKKFKVISNTKTDQKIARILNTKTHMIIDKRDESLQNFINNYLKNPYYRLEVKLKSGEVITYIISHPIKAIADLKIEKKQFFLMTASNRHYPYVIGKKFYRNFIIKYKDIKN